MIQTKTTSSSTTWSEDLRNRVGDSVVHSGSIWINKNGKNSEPGIGNDWDEVPSPSEDYFDVVSPDPYYGLRLKPKSPYNGLYIDKSANQSVGMEVSNGNAGTSAIAILSVTRENIPFTNGASITAYGANYFRAKVKGKNGLLSWDDMVSVILNGGLWDFRITPDTNIDNSVSALQLLGNGNVLLPSLGISNINANPRSPVTTEYLKNIIVVNSNTLITVNNHTVEGVIGGIDFELPSSVGISGTEFILKNSSTTGFISIITDGAETIDGYPEFQLHPDESLTIKSNDTGWIITKFYQKKERTRAEFGSGVITIHDDIFVALNAPSTWILPALSGVGRKKYRVYNKSIIDKITLNGASMPTNTINGLGLGFTTISPLQSITVIPDPDDTNNWITI